MRWKKPVKTESLIILQQENFPVFVGFSRFSLVLIDLVRANSDETENAEKGNRNCLKHSDWRNFSGLGVVKWKRRSAENRIW